MMNILEALNWRYAVKEFSEQVLEDKQVKELLQAITLSASAHGLQPYKILVVSDQATRTALIEHSYGQDKVLHSSHLIVLAAKVALNDEFIDSHISSMAKAHNLNEAVVESIRGQLKTSFLTKSPQQQQEWAKQQLYIALGNMLTSAAVMKIDACPMTGFDVAGYNEVLGLTSQGLTATAICPIGFRHPEDSRIKSAKLRLDYDQLVQLV